MATTDKNVAPAGSQTENLPPTPAVAPAPGHADDDTSKGSVMLRTASRSDRFVYSLDPKADNDKVLTGEYTKFSQKDAKVVRELAAANGVRLLEKSADDEKSGS